MYQLLYPFLEKDHVYHLGEQSVYPLHLLEEARQEDDASFILQTHTYTKEEEKDSPDTGEANHALS